MTTPTTSHDPLPVRARHVRRARDASEQIAHAGASGGLMLLACAALSLARAASP